MPAPVSLPDLSPTQLRLYRSQPQRTTLLWVVLVVVVAIAMLAPVVLSKATPSARQATAPLVVSDPLAGSGAPGGPGMPRRRIGADRPGVELPGAPH